MGRAQAAVTLPVPAIQEKTTFCRFMDIVTAAEKSFGCWHRDLFERSTVALDLGFLRGKAFEARVMARREHIDEVGESNASTNPKRLKVDDRAIRSCATNAVAISVMMLDSDDNRRAVACVLAAARPVKTWHCFQSETLRQSSRSKELLINQVGKSGYMNHIKDILRQSSKQDSLEAACFIV